MIDLYTKYKAEHCKEVPELNPLSFILRKAELSENLTTAEWEWLDQHQFVDTKAVIKNQEDYRISLLKEHRREILQLKKNPLISFTINTIPSIDSEISLVLYKINTQERLLSSELRLVGSRYHKFLDFKDRISKLGITEDIPFNDTSENILLKLESKISLSASDIQWLRINNAYSFLNRPKEQLSSLQKKYKVFISEGDNVDLFLLFYMLQKLEENDLLNQEEALYLKEHGFTETLGIVQQREFTLLKEKYKATKIQDNSHTHHLFKVLKNLDSGASLTESDINYLKKRKLINTVKFIYKKEVDCLTQKINQGHGLRPDDIVWCEGHNFEEIIFKWLKNEYELKYNNKPGSPLYTILRKLEAGHRLSDDDIVWLESEKLLRRPSKVFIAHHTLEALFFENEFQRLKDHWKLASGSAHWRKADEPQKALSLTDNLNYKKIKPAKLRAALCTTRGGAFRDIEDLVNAEKCALEAIEYFPDSHNPYTLMGALCYDNGDYGEGDRWFEEAIKRGAKPHDQDSEIKRILRKKPNPELIAHLLKKDPKRFSWVKDFSRGSANRKK